jgi:hypothetical protein
MTPIEKSESLEYGEEKRVSGEDALALWARAWSALKRIWFDSDQLRQTAGPHRLVFVDDAGANLAMARSHAWVKRSGEYVEPRITCTLRDSNIWLSIWMLGGFPLKLLLAYSEPPSPSHKSLRRMTAQPSRRKA